MSSSEPQQIDLETFLGVLDREQLQALLVSLIIRDPTGKVFDLVEQATEFLDHEQLLLSIEPLVDITDLNDLDTAIQPLRTRFQGYMSLQLYDNALVVLYAFTNQAIMNIIEAGIEPTDETLKQMIIDLENDWKGLVEVYTLSDKTKNEIENAEKEQLKKLNKMVAESEKNQKATNIHAQKASERVLTSANTRAVGKKGKKLAEMKEQMDEDDEMDEYIPSVDAPMTLMKIFEQLANWRQQLQVLGPIFGDALRVLKLRIIADGEKQKEAAKSAGAASANAIVSANASQNLVPESQPTTTTTTTTPAVVKKKALPPGAVKKAIRGTAQGAIKRASTAQQPGAVKKTKRAE